jgi:hypothetical protein
MREKPDCYKCKYRKDLIGDAHSSCECKGAKVVGDKWGIKNGWFFHPFNFDPVWLESCDSFSPKHSASKLIYKGK